MSAALEDDKLQQYFDGELSDVEMDAMRHELGASAELRGRLAALEQMRRMLAVAAEDLGGELASEDLFEAIRTGIERSNASDPVAKPDPRPALKLVAGGKAASQPPAPRKPTVAERLRIAVPVTATFAVAAVALLTVMFGSKEPGPAPMDGQAQTTPMQIDDNPIVVLEPPHGSEVEQVDFGHNTGTVFAVEGEAGEPIAVVWITDEVMEETL